MKRRTPHARTARRQRRGFTLRPLALALALALPGTLLAGGVDPTVVGGQASVLVNGDTTTITQGSSRAIIDWRSLSLTQQERFLVLQGSAKDVLLNRVTGFEPSVLDGSIQAIGRVYFLNPNGIIFGEHAQIDVGGLVASTLALGNEDFMAGRIQLTPTTGFGDYAGRVINRGRVNAAGGEIVLAGLDVSNQGTLSAPGGRVGLVAADEVLVDVEGDGLLFFNVKAADAGARVAQLGRIEADGGAVHLRAEARGTFADTVLNMDGVVQARSLGARNGRVVVDGGAHGLTQVAGSIDATGSEAGQTGGRITVTGDRTLLASTAVLDASGAAAGGSIQVGGGFQGNDAAVRNATVTGVVGGATLRANAQQSGNGGQVVVWADDTTRYEGRIEARGGAQGGNGGQVEVSGKLSLGYRGTVDTSAAAGRVGTLLLDPRDLAVTNNAGGTAISWTAAAGVNGSTDAEVDVASINSSTADVTLTASRNMGINAAINITNAGTTFSATATNNINVIADITTNGGAISLSGGTLTLGANLDAGAAAVSLTGPVTLAGGARSITGSTIGINNSLAGASHALTLAATGTATLAGNVTGVSTLTSTTGTTAINAEVTTSGTQSYGAVTLGGSGTGRTLTGGGVTLGAVTGNGKDLGVVGGLTLNGDVTGVATLASTGSPTTINANVNTTAGQAYGAVTLGGSSATRTLTAGTTVSVGAVTGAGNSLTVAATTSATLGGAVAGVAALDTTGSTTTAVNADVTTIGNQTYGAMTLGGSGGTRTLAGSTVALGTVAGGGKNLTVSGSTSATIGGAVTNVAALDTSGSAATALNANVTTTGAQTYNLATLGGNTALGGSSVTFNGAVAGASHGLTVTTAGVLALNGGASGLSTLDASAATGGSSIGGNVTTSGAQTYAGTTTLTAAASFQGGSLGFNNLAAGSNALGLRADAITVSGTATGSGTATFEPLSNTGSIGVAGGAGTLQLSQALLNKFSGFTGITIGSLANDYTISFGNFTLPANLTVRSNSGNIGFGTLDGARSLQAQTTGTITMNDIVGGTTDLTSINLNGTITINAAAVQTSGSQLYSGAVTLQRNTVLDGTTVTFGSTVAGAGQSLEVNGNATFGGAVGAGAALASVDVSGTTSLAGNVSTTGNQVYGGAVTLSAASTTLSGGTVEFNGTVNGTVADAQALTITGNADIGGAVGGATRLASLGVSGTTALAANVTTSGAQTYTGNVTLGGNSSLGSSASTIGFGGTVDGGFSLATTTAGGTTFGGAVGGGTALGALQVTGQTTLNGGAVTTTGNQTYSSVLTLGANTTFTGTDLSVSGTMDVAGHDIGLRLGGALNLASIINATGATAGIAARDAGTSIGVAGGAGSLQISQTTIDRFSSFGTVTIGRSDGSGAVTFGNATINRTLGVTTGSGDVTFGTIQTNVDGAYNLTVNTTSGLVRFNGDIGTVSRLNNLVVNGNARLAGTDIFTAGNQTYNGNVTLASDLNINGNVLDFTGTIDGARNLSTTGFTVTHFRGEVGGTTALTSLSASGVVDTRADITATSSQTYSGSVTLLGDTTFTAASLSFNALNAGSRALGLVYDSMGAIPSLTGTGSVQIAPYTSTTNITVATSTSGIGDLVIDASTFAQYATFSGLIIGRAGSGGTSGTITVGDSGTTLSSLPANLTLNSSGVTTLQASLNQGLGATSFVVSGPVQIAGSLSITAGNIGFGGTIDGASAGAQGLTLVSATTSLGGSVGSTTRLATLDITGATTLGNASINTTGNQVYRSPVTLAGNATLDANGSGYIWFQNAGATINGAHALTVNTTSNPVYFYGDVGNATPLAALTVNAGAVTGSGSGGGGHITTSGAQDWNGLVRLRENSTFTGSNVAFDGGLSSESGGTGATITASGTTTLGGVVGATALSSLGTSGATTINASGVTTTGAQTYGGAVTLGANSTLAGNTITFNGTVNGARALTINDGGTTTFTANVGGSTPLTSLTTGSGGSTVLPAAVTTTGAQTYNDSVTLSANTVLSANGVTMANLVGASNALQIASAGLVDLNGSITGLTAFDASGSGTVRFDGNAGLVTTGAQHYGGDVVVSVNGAAFSGSTLDFDGSLASATNLTLTTDSLDVAGAISGAGVFTLTPTSAGTTIGLAGGSGALSVDLSQVSGFTQTIIGRTDGSGAINIGNVTLGTATTLRSGTGAINFNGTVDGARALVINSGGATTFSGAVGATTALASLSTDAGGTTAVNGGSVRTSGAQAYGDAVTYSGSAAFAGSSLGFGGGASGGTNLTLTTDSFSVTGSLSGSGVLTIQPTAAGTTIGLSGGAGALQITQAALGQIGGFSSQVFGRSDGTGAIGVGALALARDTTLRSASGNIAFGSTVDGAHDLVVNTAGITSFGGAVGAGTALASLQTDAGGSTQVNGGGVTTSGAQTYGDALTYSGAAFLRGDSVTLAQGASGGTDLGLVANHLSVSGGLSGSGVLTLQPFTAGTTIGLAGGTGTLQLSQSLLNQATGFASVVIGRSDGSGNVDAGALTLTSNTTVQSGSGNIEFDTIDGARSLTVNTTGATRFGGNVGGTTRLSSLSTDAPGSTRIDAAFIRTSNGILLSDTVHATGTLVLDATSAGNVTADAAGNEFDGALAIDANRVALSSHNSLTLGGVSLASGGSIATDGVLTVGGNLDQTTPGGDLTLTARGTPTTIAFTDSELASLPRIFNGLTLQEATSVIRQSGGRIATASGSLLNLVAANGGSINLEQANLFNGSVSAVSTSSGDPATRFSGSGTLALNFVRLNSGQLNVGGAGIDADAVKLTADRLSTATGSTIRARLPYNNTLGLETALPALTLVLSPAALDGSAGSKPYGGLPEAERIQVDLGDAIYGGFLTVRPKGGAAGSLAFVSLGGPLTQRPFYDGSGKLTEIQVFYNGEVPQTPQEVGALSAVTAVIEDARRARFDEAVRTENVSSRLRSGVIAEVGAGRPATEGSESIKTPETCSVQAGTLRCAQ
jgi:filamentous hemagglutinin family protein